MPDKAANNAAAISTGLKELVFRGLAIVKFNG